MKELMPGVRLWKNPKNKFAVLRIHYTADDEKRNPVWLAAAKAGMSQMDWEREMEINFSQSRAKRLFPGYDENTQFKEIQVNPYIIFHRCWDFGFRHPFCGISQIGLDGTWYLHRELLGNDIILEDFIPLAIKLLPKFIKTIDEDGYKEEVEVVYKDYCDPAGSQRSDKSKRTSIEILKSFNIHPVYKKSAPVDRARIIRSQMAPRPNGEPGMVVSTKCPLTNAGFMGGFHFSENPTPGSEDEPEKEGYYEHLLDGWGYMAYSHFRPWNRDPNNKRKVKYRKRRFNPIIGI